MYAELYQLYIYMYNSDCLTYLYMLLIYMVPRVRRATIMLNSIPLLIIGGSALQGWTRM